jgi:hypothetical protein
MAGDSPPNGGKAGRPAVSEASRRAELQLELPLTAPANPARGMLLAARVDLACGS